jgi:hypothetical protein
MCEVVPCTDGAVQARQEITRAGGRVLHMLAPSILVAELPTPAALKRWTTVRPEEPDPVSVRVVNAWAVVIEGGHRKYPVGLAGLQTA